MVGLYTFLALRAKFFYCETRKFYNYFSLTLKFFIFHQSSKSIRFLFFYQKIKKILFAVKKISTVPNFLVAPKKKNPQIQSLNFNADSIVDQVFFFFFKEKVVIQFFLITYPGVQFQFNWIYILSSIHSLDYYKKQKEKLQPYLARVVLFFNFWIRKQRMRPLSKINIFLQFFCESMLHKYVIKQWEWKFYCVALKRWHLFWAK